MADGRSDGELVGATLAGQEDAFGELVARYKDAVFGVAFHRLGDFEEARDAAQDAFLTAYLNLGKLRQPTSFAHWLYRIADGAALDALRRKRGEVSLEVAGDLRAPLPTTEDRAEQAELARRIKEALATLSEATRLAVILHYVNGYSHAEVASFIGTTPGAVKTRLSRAKSRLQGELAEMVEEKLKKESAVFTYEATDDSGRVITGTSEAKSASAIRRRLTEKGYRVVRMERDRRTPEEREAEEGEPITRVARVILEQALKDRAAEIRIGLRPSKPEATVGVRYLVAGGWHLVMVVPHYVWPPLRAKLAEMAGVQLEEARMRQPGTIRFEFQNRVNELKATFNPKSIRIQLPQPD
jgi:RNA polymerase sigma-70 factor (ECF subfamily)